MTRRPDFRGASNQWSELQTRTSGGAFRHLFYTDAINRVRTVDGNYEKLFFIWPAGSCPGGAAHIRWAVFCRDAINRVRTGW